MVFAETIKCRHPKGTYNPYTRSSRTFRHRAMEYAHQGDYKEAFRLLSHCLMDIEHYLELKTLGRIDMQRMKISKEDYKNL
jgi:hypothetical protein